MTGLVTDFPQGRRATVDNPAGRPAPRRPLRLLDDGDRELLRRGREVLELMVEWEAQPPGLSMEQEQARTAALERRFFALQDRFAELDPATFAGLAMTMRVAFTLQDGGSGAAAAMLRPDGPSEAELHDTSGDAHMLWLFVDDLERIAGLRPAPPAA